jgi:glycosyltransferase involved in cell wall biosynthesis
MSDYHAERLNVIKACLETMRINAGDENFQVLVWDNGSCDQLTHWLRRSYQPDLLVEGPNVGKWNARASIVRMLPPGTIVGVSDDDMFYYPGWLDAHMEVLDTYPKVGTVSGWPVRTQHRFHSLFTRRWGERLGCIEYGRYISEQEDEDFCTSIGRDYKWHIDYTKDDSDARINYRGVWTYATGHHCQFIGYAGVLAEHTEFSNEAMPSERPFEQSVDHAELLRLTTYKRCTRHIGNVLDKRLEDEWRKIR